MFKLERAFVFLLVFFSLSLPLSVPRQAGRCSLTGLSLGTPLPCKPSRCYRGLSYKPSHYPTAGSQPGHLTYSRCAWLSELGAHYRQPVITTRSWAGKQMALEQRGMIQSETCAVVYCIGIHLEIIIIISIIEFEFPVGTIKLQ